MTKIKKAVLYPESQFLAPFGLPFRIFYHKQSLSAPHYHDFHELVIVTGGRGRHHTPDKVYPINLGDVFVLKPGMSHYYDKISDLKFVNILFKLKELDQNEHGLREIPGYYALFEAEPELRKKSGFKWKHTLSAEELTRAETILGQILEEQSKKEPGYVFVCMSLFQQLIAYICRCYGLSRLKTSRKVLQLSRILKYIEDNYDKEISLEDLAARGNMSVSSANRLFNEALNESPVTYLIKTRIAHAAELLKREDLSISETAFRCGYKDSNYFSLQFKKLMGASPKKYKSLKGCGN